MLKQFMEKKEIDAVVKCLNESTQMGHYARIFEKEIAKFFNKKTWFICKFWIKCVIYWYGGIRVPKGGEVITPALTFSTTIGGGIVESDLIPVFIDVGKKIIALM